MSCVLRADGQRLSTSTARGSVPPLLVRTPSKPTVRDGSTVRKGHCGSTVQGQGTASPPSRSIATVPCSATALLAPVAVAQIQHLLFKGVYKAPWGSDTVMSVLPECHLSLIPPRRVLHIGAREKESCKRVTPLIKGNEGQHQRKYLTLGRAISRLKAESGTASCSGPGSRALVSIRSTPLTPEHAALLHAGYWGDTQSSPQSPSTCTSVPGPASSANTALTFCTGVTAAAVSEQA